MPDYTRRSYRLKEAFGVLLRRAAYCLILPVAFVLLVDFVFLRGTLTITLLTWPLRP
jgi:hypothetical protein